jgi:CubicO group peptidase (beta-lactamase class C family)
LFATDLSHNASMSEFQTEFPRTAGVITHGMTGGLHIGAQLFISRDGRPLADVAFGRAGDQADMTLDSMMIWLSSSKPVTAVAIAQLWEQGRLHLDDPIAVHIPEFAAHGKQAVTIRHALTHTGGFRGIASRYDSVPWEQAIAAICDVRLEPNWTPGHTAGYHIASSWYILGEIVQRLSGRQFSEYVREKIFLPLGMADSWIGMPAEVFAEYGDRLGVMHLTDGGAVRPHPSLDREDATVSPRPGSNGRGPMRDLARFYQFLLDGITQTTPLGGLPASAGSGLLRPQTIEALVARHRTGLLDQTFRLTLDWSLGLIPNTPGEDMQRFAYGFGPHASPRAFGHGGNQSSLAMADPEHGLVIAVVFNGMPGEPAHAARMRALMTAIYEDLGGSW